MQYIHYITVTCEKTSSEHQYDIVTVRPTQPRWEEPERCSSSLVAVGHDAASTDLRGVTAGHGTTAARSGPYLQRSRIVAAIGRSRR